MVVFRGEEGGGGGEGGISQYRGVDYSGGTQVVQASWPIYVYICIYYIPGGARCF